MSATTHAAIVAIGQKFGGKHRVATHRIAISRPLPADGFAMQGHNHRKSRMIRVQTSLEWHLNSVYSQYCLISHYFIVASFAF